MNTKTQKLTFFEKTGYAFGDAASNLFWMTFIYFQSKFYTDVFFYTPDAALERSLLQKLAALLLLTRFLDMAFDLSMGVLGDRTRTRWGKFRPYLLWFAIPFGIISVLTFTTPSFSPNGKLIYAYITLCLMMMVYSAINIPYSALMGVISPDSQERTSVSSYRFAFAFGAGLVVQYCDALPGGLLRKSKTGDGRGVISRGQSTWLSTDDGHLCHCGNRAVFPHLRAHA